MKAEILVNGTLCIMCESELETIAMGKWLKGFNRDREHVYNCGSANPYQIKIKAYIQDETPGTSEPPR